MIKIKNKRQLIEDSGSLGYSDDRIAIISAINEMLICRFQLRMRIRSAAETLDAVESKKTTTKGKVRLEIVIRIWQLLTLSTRSAKILYGNQQTSTTFISSAKK